MSTEPKLRGPGPGGRHPGGPQPGGKTSPLTRLKELCLKKPAAREEIWEWRKESGLTNAAIRGRIEARFGIQLLRDGQLSEFWSWLGQVIREDKWNNRVEQFEAWYRKSDPQASVERVREAGIAFFLTEAAASEDQKAFVEISKLDLKKRGMETKAKFEERKVSVSERRIGLLEKKAELADKAKGIAASNLSDEEKAARMREVFGIA